jgi:hypothetical protein
MVTKLAIGLLFAALSVCGLMMGAGIASLSGVEARLAGLTPDDRALAPALAQEIDAWSSFPGLGNEAATLAVRLARNAAAMGDLDALNRRLEDKLRRQPASSPDWLLLAQARLARGAPMDAVTRALEYSIVTGRYERAVMIDRVGFSVTVWPFLTDDLKRQMATELGHAGRFLTHKQLQFLKTWIAALPADDRDFLASSLSLRFGARIPSWVKVLRLEPKAAQ